MQTYLIALDKSGNKLWVVRNRRDLINKVGVRVYSVNENRARWYCSDPAHTHSLPDIDLGYLERATGLIFDYKLEALGSGNSKQRRAQRRKRAKNV